MSKPKIETVLRWVNARRREMGKPPLVALPHGERKAFDRCPLALALEARVFSSSWRVRSKRGWGRKRLSPSYIEGFVQRFDHGEYPELILDD